MFSLILIIFFSIGVSIINGSSCSCCFPWQTQECQTPAIYISCTDCTSFFCANHVKGCQGSPCNAVCTPDSSTIPTNTTTTTTTTATTATTTTTINSTTNESIVFTTPNE